MKILKPEKKHVRLFTLEDQQSELERWGLRGLYRQAFSREFSELSADDFLHGYLMKIFQPRALIVGHNFQFGAHRLGTLELLKDFCDRHQITLRVIPAFNIESEVVSTSRIRQHLLAGQLAAAEKMLGRRYYIEGVVEKGEARGRQLGFPTANIRPDIDFYPRMGVYVCLVHISAQSTSPLRAVMNVGLNRTFVEGDHHPIKAEVHLLDFNQDLYGQTLKVELCHYLRDEKKFASVGDLKLQIAADIESARRWEPQ